MQFDPGDALNYFFLNFHDDNIVFTFHYLKYMASTYIYILFYCLLVLILNHHAGCSGLLALCLCLSVCVLAITGARSNAKIQTQQNEL